MGPPAGSIRRGLGPFYVREREPREELPTARLPYAAALRSGPRILSGSPVLRNPRARLRVSLPVRCSLVCDAEESPGGHRGVPTISSHAASLAGPPGDQ